MIAVEGLRKRYGSTLAVDSMSFAAEDGLVTGLPAQRRRQNDGAAGRSGAREARRGARLDRRSGRDARSVCRADAPRNAAPEAAALYDRLTVREHLEYSAALQDVAGAARRARVDVLLEQMGLTALSGRLAGGLSLGQRRRVALARALVHDPPNVVLDEPTNGLDVLGAREVRLEIRRLAEAGRTVVLSTHVMPDVSAVCDRIVVVARGRVVASGTPAAILARTGAAALEDAFVAAIGSEEGLQ